MKPVPKFDIGNSTTLCNDCNSVISYQISSNLICAECLEKLLNLKDLTGQLIYIFEYVEESDNGRVFHPTTITSCRTDDIIKLGEIMSKITDILG